MANAAEKIRAERSRIKEVKDDFIRAAIAEWESKRDRRILLKADADWRDYVVRRSSKDKEVLTLNYIGRAVTTGRITPPSEKTRP